ncbi:hypothetical protein D3C79_348460 [compost metagenome]
MRVGTDNDAGSSGTGVQDVCLRGTKIIVCLSANIGSSVDQAEIYSVTFDRGERRKTDFFLSEEAFTNSTRATDFSANYLFGSVNIVDVGGVNGTLRMNGQVVIQEQDTAVRWGSITGAANKLHVFNNGLFPGDLSAEGGSTNVTLWGSSGVTEIRAGTAQSNASIKLDTVTKRITIANPSNAGGGY